jgi:hypothetical protein
VFSILAQIIQESGDSSFALFVPNSEEKATKGNQFGNL